MLWTEPPTLDPHLATDTTSAGIVVEVFSGLVRLNPDLQIRPDLAESWKISGDLTVYEFKLRKDLRFSNGEPLTTSDFKWSMERAAHPDTRSPVAETYLGDIIGVPEIISGDGAITEALGIEAIDDRILRITTDAPKAYFIAKLTYTTAYVLNRENVLGGGDSWTDNAVGIGPFVLDQHQIGERIVLVRNDNYWGRKAYLDQVVFNLAGGAAMTMYENDEIDITGVGLADRPRVEERGGPFAEELVVVPAGFSTQYIGFNTEIPPFDDLKFRQALSYAVDKELIADQVYLNTVRPAYGILPPNFPGYSDSIEGLRFDPEMAAQLLAESRYADPADRPPIVVTVPGTGGAVSPDIQIVAAMWKQVLDIDIELQQVEWATYLRDLDRQNLQVFGGLGWVADYPDPHNFIDILFHSESAGNHGAYSNPNVDRLIEEARTERDIIRRLQLYNEAEQTIVDNAAWLPMWFDVGGLALVKPHVRGFKFTPIIVPVLKDVYFVE